MSACCQDTLHPEPAGMGLIAPLSGDYGSRTHPLVSEGDLGGPLLLPAVATHWITAARSTRQLG